MISRLQKSIPVLAAVFLVAACSGGSTDATPTALPPAPPTGPTAAELLTQELTGLTLQDFYDVSFKALMLRDPEAVIWHGLEGIYPLDSIGLTDLSDAYKRATYAMYDVVLQALQTYDREALDADGKISYDVYAWFLQDKVDESEFIYYGFPASYSIFGAQADTRLFFTDVHPLETRQDAENYISRLTAVRQKFRQLAAHLRLQRNAGVIEPALTLRIADSQALAVVSGSPDTSPYYTVFRDKLETIAGLSTADKAALRGAALAATRDSVIPAHQELRNTFVSLLADASPSIGVSQFPRGRDYYSYILRHHTTTDLTPARIHQLGLDELQRIRAEMRAIFDQLGYPQNESLLTLFGRVANDGGFIPGADTLATFENLVAFAEQNLAQAFDLFPAAEVVVIPDTSGGFYIGPSFDGSRPGAFYAGTGRDLPYYDMPTLTFHEAVPGHHLQIALAHEMDLPAFRKILRSTAFVEGWALYAERLAYELGWYDNDPYGNLGRLQFEALRAARLVMDTGIHDLGWSFDQATQFNIDNVGWSPGASQGAAARYSVLTGQATAYMIGMLTILELRQRAMDQLGAAFDLKAFHRLVLGSGGVPLSILEQIVDNYIAASLASSVQ